MTAVRHFVDDTPYTTSSCQSQFRPASFGKPKREVENALPKCPRKRIVVLARFAEVLKVQAVTKTDPNARDRSNKCAIVTFYNLGDVDFVTFRHEDRTKERIQKRHLVITTGEVYNEYIKETLLHKVGKPPFASLRPQHVVINSEMLHNVCDCK